LRDDVEMGQSQANPGEHRPLPPEWRHVREAIYADAETYGRNAAHFIKVYRRASGEAPTFREFFQELVPEMALLRFDPGHNSARRNSVRQTFMRDIAFALLRAGWIDFGRTNRSLQTGPRAKYMPPCGIHCNSAHFITQREWAVNIRKFTQRIHNLHELVELGSLTRRAAEYLRMSVLAGQNILVSGATQTGKTTMLNALLSCARPSERVVTVEETFELDFAAPDRVAMQCRQPSLEGTGEITLRRLIKESLRMRPDRLVVGEVREAESLDLLIALNSGLPGMSSIHANSARDALSKLSTLPLLAGRNIDSGFVVPTVAGCIDLVVHLELRKGHRRVVELLAPSGNVTSGVIEASAIFALDGGQLEPTGSYPTRTVKFEAAGFDPARVLAP